MIFSKKNHKIHNGGIQKLTLSNFKHSTVEEGERTQIEYPKGLYSL